MDFGGLIVLAALVLLFLGLVRLRRAMSRPKKVKEQRRRQRIVVDGTNVLFWRDNTAQLKTLQIVLNELRRRDFDPVVFLDASSRHHISDRSMSPERFADMLMLDKDRIMVCPAGTEADAFILDYAQSEKLGVVSNDRFRDRPREARDVRLFKGRFDGDRLILKGL